jgi:epoxyqueuosine reductase
LDTLKTREVSSWIKSKALDLGFSACGIAEAGYLADDAARLERWLSEGFQGEMGYMARNAAKRTDPGQLLPGARSVISVLMNYKPGIEQPEESQYRVSKYAYGKDYHFVIRERLYRLILKLTERIGKFRARAFTDSAPVLDRAWAARSGLGWIGKNTCLIHPKLGSFVFIGEIITDLELDYDTVRINDLCGGCTRCIDACPTAAITEARNVDARKCISYFTIEFKGSLPAEYRERFNNWIFGCDICQDVCPWNRKSSPNNIDVLSPVKGLMDMDREKWERLDLPGFEAIFEGSAMQRAGFDGLRRNIDFVMNSD